jgi:superkiller protein 8
VHHLAASVDGSPLAVSAGFGGEVRIWRQADGGWEAAGRVRESVARKGEKSPAGELWALALTRDGRYLAASAYDGRVRIWDMKTGEAEGKGVWEPDVVREYNTRGSFGMCVALVSCCLGWWDGMG